MINTLDTLPKIKVKLSVPLIATFLATQYNPYQISKKCNISHQAVNDYIKRHYDKLVPLIDNQDVLAAMHSKYIAQQAKDKLNDILNTCTTFDKRDLIPLTAVSDRHTNQYRLLSDKSTSNVSVDQLPGRKNEREQRKLALLDELKQVKGNVIDT